MKKSINSIVFPKLTLLLLLLCLIICGCSGEINEESTVNSDSISENEIYSESDEVSVETENDYPNYIIAEDNAVELELFAEIDLDEYCTIQMLLDDCIIYTKEHYTPINEKNYDYNTDYEYFVYDIKTNEHKSIGTINNIFAVSGDILLAPDGYVYLTCQTKINPMTIYQVNPVALFKLDIENGGIIEVYSNDTGLPEQDITVLDDNHLAIFEPHKTDDGNKYTITIYDLYTQETKVIFETKQTMGEEESIGEILVSAQAYNGEIYCLMLDDEYRIDVINADGEFLRTISLDNEEIDEASSSSGRVYDIVEMIIVDDVIWFNTFADTLAPFSISDGKLLCESLKGYALSYDFKNVERKSVLGNSSKSIPLFRKVEDKLVKHELNYEPNVKSDDGRMIREYPIMSYSGDYIGIQISGIDKTDPGPTKLFLYKILYN